LSLFYFSGGQDPAQVHGNTPSMS